MKLSERNKVEKRNDLNEIKTNSMTMQQLRLFTIYLSKINSRDISTRCVRFPLSDFQKIMDIGRLNIFNLKTATDGLLRQLCSVPLPSGGYRSYQLFKECIVDKDPETGEWFVEIDAHDKALELFFEFKEKYFTYDVGNMLRLSSANQMRMYEVLKQREKMKQPVIISISDLRMYLGIDKKQYSRYQDFRVRVIDKAKTALAAETDITFTYAPVKSGRRIDAIAFTIKKNKKRFSQSDIEELIEQMGEPSAASIGSPDDAPDAFYAAALPGDLTPEEVEVLRSLAVKHVDTENGLADAELKTYDYLEGKTKLLYAQRNPVKPQNYFAWLKRAVTEDW